MNLVAWLKQSFDNMVYGGEEYLEVGKPGTVPYYRTNKYIEEVTEHLREGGWTATNEYSTMADIYEEAELELYDDFHNCGGIILNRIWDIHCLYHHFEEELQQKLLEFIASELELEFKWVE